MSGFFEFLIPFIFLEKIIRGVYFSFVLSDFYSLIESLTTTIFLATTTTHNFNNKSCYCLCIRNSGNKIVIVCPDFTSNYTVAGLVSALALLTLADYLTKIARICLMGGCIFYR